MTFEVGQRVWCYDLNSRGQGPGEGVVTKVGRKLVTVEQYGRERRYRIEGGGSNDPNYGHHHWIKTDEQRAEDERRREVLAALDRYGVTFKYGVHLPLPVLAGLLAVLDEPTL